MKILKLADTVGDFFPKGIRRLDYESGVDVFQDWALLLPGRKSQLWIIMIHGHGSTGDQLYTNRDIRENWLPVFLESGAGILTVNLRGNSWMGPAAADDMHALVGFLRDEYGMQKSIFSSGSMGATSNLIYGILYPEDVNGIIALCPASDLAPYYQWCRQQDKPILQEIAAAIEKSYGGTPDEVPEIYRKHSALFNADRLVMPVFISHGNADAIIPVEQSRTLADKMKHNKNFNYREIPGGGHDLPLDTMNNSFSEVPRGNLPAMLRIALQAGPRGIFAEPCEARSEASERATDAIHPCGKPQGFLAKKGKILQII